MTATFDFFASDAPNKNRIIEPQERLLRELELAPGRAAPQELPPGAYVARIGFTLGRPYISRDEPFPPRPENAILRDAVFHVPMASGSGWKGALRAAAVERFVEHLEPKAADRARDRVRLYRLFGSEVKHLRQYLDKACGPEATGIFGRLLGREERDDDEDGPRLEGRVHPLPTFFAGGGRHATEDVLNRRDPRSRAGSRAVRMEVVPAGTPGTLCLLWIPFDLYGKPQEEIQTETARDWKVLRPAIEHMLLRTGFGAKTSSGYGVAKPGSLAWEEPS
jgi:CRISPR-associated protein Cmr2